MADFLNGLVIAHLGKGLAIESAGKTIICQTRRQLGIAAVGDQVLWEKTGPDQGRVTELLPRRSVLTRPARQGKTRPVAANIDKVIVVFATKPRCDFLLIDQYLAVCENRNISAELVFNKIDLSPNAERQRITAELTRYQDMGYRLHSVSATTGKGLSTLTDTLTNKTSILAGQSGVGKSSLTNVLIPDKLLKTNTLSEANAHGRHTTTTATLYHLPNGGDLIDSPGVAIFGLAGLTEAQLAYGFREFQPFIEACQFNDCRHQKDKGCAVRNAVENQVISLMRYQRFLKLKEKMNP